MVTVCKGWATRVYWNGSEGMYLSVLKDLELRRKSFQITKVIVIIYISKKDPGFLSIIYVLVKLKVIWLNQMTTLKPQIRMCN